MYSRFSNFLCLYGLSRFVKYYRRTEHLAFEVSSLCLRETLTFRGCLCNKSWSAQLVTPVFSISRAFFNINTNIINHQQSHLHPSRRNGRISGSIIRSSTASNGAPETPRTRPFRQKLSSFARPTWLSNTNLRPRQHGILAQKHR